MITPQMLAAALRAAANALDGPSPSAVVAALISPPPPPPLNVPEVTADQLTALITPHVVNENIKAALGASMRALGVNALVEAQPHQYGALYAAFQAVLAAHGIGAAGTSSPPPPPATSII